MVDTVYVNWAFPATGAGTNKRTMPDRLADVYNVKDWGAVGTGGGSDDTSAIQAAITAAMSAGGGIVFFPPGTYNISSLLTIGSGAVQPIALVGSGKDNTVITSTAGGGYPISKNGQTVDNIQRIQGFTINGSGSGCVQVTGTCVSIDDCLFNGSIGLEATTAAGCSVTNSQAVADSNSAPDTASPGPTAGGIGFCMGQCVMIDCRATNSDIGYALSGAGSTIISCSGEVNNTAIRVGWGPAGSELAASGGTIQNFQTERSNTALDVYNATGYYIAGNAFTGGAGTPASPSTGLAGEISAMAWNAGGGTPFVTVTTSNPHLLPGGVTRLQLQTGIIPSGYLPAGQSQTGFITATRTGASTFTYTGVAADPGAVTLNTAIWNYPLQYGIKIRKCYECVFSANTLAIGASVASVDFSRSGAEHRNNVMEAQDAGFGYLLPAATNLAGWKFINCTGVAHTLQAGSVASPNAQMVFADLPGQSGVFQDGPFEGMEYDIKDGDSSAFDATQTGGGSGHYKVRYNGSDWKRIG